MCSSPYRRYGSSTRSGRVWLSTPPVRGRTVFVYCAIGSGYDTARAQTLHSSSSTLSGPASPLPVRGRIPWGLAVPLPVRGRIVMCSLSGQCCHCPCVHLALWLVRIFNYGSAVIFGVRLPTSRLCGVIDSVILRSVCLLRHQLLMPPPLFRPRSLPSHYPTSGHVRQRLHMGLATFYGIGIMPLVSRVGVGLVLAHCRELLAQIGESVKRSYMPSFPVQLSSSRHWVQSSICPQFRRRSTVTDIQLWYVTLVSGSSAINNCLTAQRQLMAVCSRAGIICSSNTFTASLHAVVSLISMDVAHLAAADILPFIKSQHSRTSSLLRGHRDSRSRDCVLYRLFLSGHVTPFKVRLRFLIVVITSLISVFMAPAATIPFIEPLLTLSLYLRRLSTPSSRGYTRAHARDSIRVVHALGITNTAQGDARSWLSVSRRFIVSSLLCAAVAHRLSVSRLLTLARDIMGMPVSSSDAWLVVGEILSDEYRVQFSRAESNSPACFSRLFIMPFQPMLAWHHPRARRALSQDAIGRALCVMDADVIQFVLDARVIRSALCQLRSTFDVRRSTCRRVRIGE
ncbi:hypothetical protein EDB85DRAFT_2293252 [Lactarius pseudohatsudake]|nr:hypothetical protein EDB85DRAFT_2293252 [Lactarius pseudohatsudake]